MMNTLRNSEQKQAFEMRSLKKQTASTVKKVAVARSAKKTALVICILSLLIYSHCKPDAQVNTGDSRQESINQLFADYDQQFQQLLANAVAAVGKETIRLEPLSDRFTVPKKLTISGTAYEIGYTIGHISNQFNHTPKQVSESKKQLNQQIIQMYQKIYPQYLEILGGIGVSFDMTVDEMDLSYMEFNFFIELWWYLLKYDQFSTLTNFAKGDGIPTNNNCSIASYFTGEHHLIGRNFDNPSDRPHYFTTSQMQGAYKMKGHSVYNLYHWVVDGMNEKGLSMNCATNGEEYFWEDPYPNEPAVFSGHMSRIVMDTCATVDEAIEKIGSAKIWFPNEGLHWVISDASGKSVVVEFDQDRNMVVLDKPGNYELMTNTALQKGEEYLNQTCFRYNRAKPMLKAGLQTMDDMLSVMDSIHFSSGSTRTLWTLIMDIKTRSFEVYYRKEYHKKYSFSF